MVARGIAETMSLMCFIASSADSRNGIGSMRCVASSACVETQFGDGGQGASLPSVTPRLVGLRDTALTTARMMMGTNRTITSATPINRKTVAMVYVSGILLPEPVEAFWCQPHVFVILPTL